MDQWIAVCRNVKIHSPWRGNAVHSVKVLQKYLWSFYHLDVEIHFRFFFFVIAFAGKCYINGSEYDDGEKKRIGCSDCTCKDGNMACLNFCTDLKCPPEQQKRISGECCPYCPGDNNEYLDQTNSVKPVLRWPNSRYSKIQIHPSSKEINNFQMKSDKKRFKRLTCVSSNIKLVAHEERK